MCNYLLGFTGHDWLKFWGKKFSIIFLTKTRYFFSKWLVEIFCKINYDFWGLNCEVENSISNIPLSYSGKKPITTNEAVYGDKLGVIGVLVLST